MKTDSSWWQMVVKFMALFFSLGILSFYNFWPIPKSCGCPHQRVCKITFCYWPVWDTCVLLCGRNCSQDESSSGCCGRFAFVKCLAFSDSWVIKQTSWFSLKASGHLLWFKHIVVISNVINFELNCNPRHQFEVEFLHPIQFFSNHLFIQMGVS